MATRFNSSLYRVMPMMQYIENDLERLNAVLSLVDLKVENNPDEWRYGDNEKPLKPTKKHLSLLIDHIRDRDCSDLKATNKNRDLLYHGSEPGRDYAAEMAHSQLEKEYDSLPIRSRRWYVFEEYSYPDIFIEGKDYIIICEGKWTEGQITEETTYLKNNRDEHRNQMVRHIQAGLNYSDKPVYAFYIVDENCGYQEKLSKEGFKECLGRETILPDDIEKQKIIESYFGYTTWQDIKKKIPGVEFLSKREILFANTSSASHSVFEQEERWFSKEAIADFLDCGMPPKFMRKTIDELRRKGCNKVDAVEKAVDLYYHQSGTICFDYSNEPWNIPSEADIHSWISKIRGLIDKLSSGAKKDPSIKKLKDMIDQIEKSRNDPQEEKSKKSFDLPEIVDSIFDQNESNNLRDNEDVVDQRIKGRIKDVFKSRPFPYRILGVFIEKPKEKIVLYVKNILHTCMYGSYDFTRIFDCNDSAFVLAQQTLLHELFHAFHFRLLKEYNMPWRDSKKGRIVKESLAMTYEYSFTSDKNRLYRQLDCHNPDAYPYSGALGLIDYGAKDCCGEIERITAEVLIESIVDWSLAEKQIESLFELRKIRKNLR